MSHYPILLVDAVGYAAAFALGGLLEWVERRHRRRMAEIGEAHRADLARDLAGFNARLDASAAATGAAMDRAAADAIARVDRAYETLRPTAKVEAPN